MKPKWTNLDDESSSFAAVNLAFEFSDHFSGGIYAPNSSGLAVMDWLVAVLKVVGAAAALLSIAPRPKLVSPSVVTVLMWGAFSTLTVYVAGSIAEAIGMALNLIGGSGHINTRSVGYVLFFLTAAVGFGALAISYSQRHPPGKLLIVLSLLSTPIVLGLTLLAVPALLYAFGLLSVF